MTKKEYFQFLFDKLSLEYKGVKLNKVLCSQLMWIAGGNLTNLGRLRTLSKFIFSFDVSELKKINLKPILVSFGYHPIRKDHRELMRTVSHKLGDNVSYVDMSRWNNHKLFLSIINIVKGIKVGVIDLRETNLKLKERLLLSAWITFYLNTIDAMSKIDFLMVKKYLCLANSLELENLVTQYLKLKGIQTYSMMEGAYFLQESELPITDISFFNLTSDIQLCWGQYSKDEFLKYGYDDSRMKVVGYPKEIDGKELKYPNKFKKGVVLLSQAIMGKQNLKLIEILSNFSYSQDFYLKLHPSLDYDEYYSLAKEKGMKIIPKEMTVNDCVDNESFDFAVAINSTAYYEALMRGLPCFRYSDGTFTSMAGCNDEFSDVESYGLQVKRIKSLTQSDFQKEIDDVLKYAVGWGINNYRRILL